MKLYREYLARHELADIQVAQHVDQGTLFFRGQNADGNTIWRMLYIQFQCDHHHPGTYRFSWMQPTHDGRGRQGVFSAIQNYDDPPQVEWDQYEDYIYGLVKKPPEGMKVVRNQAEIILCAWEMFVFAHDSELARYANKESLFRSLDTDLSIVDRHQSYQEIMFDIERNMSNYFSVWSRDMMNYIRKYCHWLADMCDNG